MKKFDLKKIVFLVVALMLTIVSVVQSEDELSYGDVEKNVNMILFRNGKHYFAYTEDNKWIGIDHVDTSAVDLDDGGIASVNVDFVRLYGGIVGHEGTPSITAIRDPQAISFDELVGSSKIADYDPEKYIFFGPRLIKTKNATYCVTRYKYGDYRLYKDGQFLGSYKTSLEFEHATGFNTLKDPNVKLEQTGKLTYYVICIEGTYYAYSRYEGFHKWTPILNRDFGNKPDGFTLKEGEVAKLSTRAIKVNGGKGNYANTPMFNTPVSDFKKLSYDVLLQDFHPKHWHETDPQNDAELWQHQDNGDEYLIFKLKGKYWVFHEKIAEKTRGLVGKYNSISKVDKAIKTKN
jgi:hypothetical protein